MSLLWAFPLGIFALGALLVPLLLHLDRRRAVRSITFAAMRWIGTRSKPRRTLRVSEWLLLALRLALIAVLALWLAQPVLRGAWRAPQHVLAVVPGVDTADAIDADRAVWLAPGFPSLDSAALGDAVPTASLLRELDAMLAPDDRLTVLVPSQVDGLEAARIVLSRDIAWRIVPAVARAAQAAAPPPPRRLALRFDDAAAPALRPLRAAIAAWDAVDTLAVTLDAASSGTPLPERADAVILLQATPDPRALDLARSGAVVLELSAAGNASATADAWPPAPTRTGRGQVLRLRVPLDPQHVPALHDADFPLQLHRVLFGDAPPPARARAADVAPLHDATRATVPLTALRSWLAWLAAALFLLERLLANGRRLARPA
ncbi:BatA domain-containing protein [Chiayiivirga flava]|uniref:Aerotolerance regulator N-terminal domain-containing protein n=1 Tax=Chiayiivirga flava TaxID=659595 RepID=A0A7W8G1V0_9GAMM|nr:BatA domain-containing protein [Chiayiivirga flava]MBB5209784.1 hypothetical protein [Chiayiivirga flava]